MNFLRFLQDIESIRLLSFPMDFKFRGNASGRDGMGDLYIMRISFCLAQEAMESSARTPARGSDIPLIILSFV